MEGAEFLLIIHHPLNLLIDIDCLSEQYPSLDSSWDRAWHVEREVNVRFFTQQTKQPIHAVYIDNDRLILDQRRFLAVRKFRVPLQRVGDFFRRKYEVHQSRAFSTFGHAVELCGIG